MNSRNEGSRQAPAMPLMTEREVAEATGGAISMRRLQNMRVAGEGPPYLKIGKSVRYEWDDVREWLASHKRRSTSDTAREAA